MPKFEICAASENDIPLIMDFIRELAMYEKLEDQVVITPALLRTHLFEKPQASCILGWEDQQAVGFAFYFYNFSTFIGKPGLYLEDLFVSPEYRGKGYGKKMLLHLKQMAIEQGCGRMEWSVLDWNTPAIDFYKSIGAEPMDEWTVFRLTLH